MRPFVQEYRPIRPTTNVLLTKPTLLCKVDPRTTYSQTRVFTMKRQPTPETSTPKADATAGVVDTATLALLARWKAENATQNAEELLAAKRELNEFKKAMNDNRAEAGELVPYPREAFSFSIRAR